MSEEPIVDGVVEDLETSTMSGAFIRLGPRAMLPKETTDITLGFVDLDAEGKILGATIWWKSPSPEA